jgi:hypothetical protein
MCLVVDAGDDLPGLDSHRETTKPEASLAVQEVSKPLPRSPLVTITPGQGEMPLQRPNPTYLPVMLHNP